MKAFILAAGMGKRLRPYTNSTPKCLIKIKGTPLLDLWVEKLLNAGVKKIYINVFHLSDKIISHVKKAKYFKKIIILKEKKLYGTAGSLNKYIKYFKSEKNIFFLHGDNFTDEDMKTFLKFHKKNSKNDYFTMMTFKTKFPSSCGIIKKDKQHYMIKYFEKKKTFNGNIANSAIYILNKKFLMEYKKNHKYAFDFSEDVVPSYVNRAKVFYSKKKFDDIGTVKIYKNYI